MDVRYRVLKAIAATAEVEVFTIESDIRLEKMGLDGANAADILITLENAFGIAIQDDEYDRMLGMTVDQLVAFTQQKIDAEKQNA